MPILRARGADFLSRDNENVRVGISTGLELASLNLLPNPDLRDFAPDGDPVECVLNSEDAAEALNNYVRQLSREDLATGLLTRLVDTLYRKQNGSPLPIDRPSYGQFQPLVSGPSPYPVTQQAPVAPFDAPEVEVVPLNRTGLAAGWVPVAIALVIGNPRRRRAMTLTGPSPVIAVEVSQNQGLDILFPQLNAEGVTGIAVLSGFSQTSEPAAKSAQLFVQRIIDIRSSNRDSWSFSGPLRTGWEASVSNTTFNGAYRQHFPLKRSYSNGLGRFRLRAFATQFSWRFRNQFGASAAQDVVTIDTTAKAGPNTSLRFHPRYRPAGADEWELLFMGPDGLWYSEGIWYPFAIGPPGARRRVRARIQSIDPKDFAPSLEPEQLGRLPREDTTGITDPDSEVESATPVGITVPEPGVYGVRQAPVYDDREGPPSKATTVRIRQGETFRVYRPRLGNLLSNAEVSEIDPGTGDPLDWTFNRTATVNVDAIRGEVTVDDSTATADDFVATEHVPVALPNDGSPIAVRVVGEVTRAGTGAVAVHAQALDATGVLIAGSNTEIMRVSGAVGTIVDQAISFGASGSGADMVFPAGAVSYDLRYVSLGTGVEGARDLGVTLRHPGMIRGLAAPRKRPEVSDGQQQSVPDVEDALDAYPEGSYSVVVEDPVSRHADLAEKPYTGLHFSGDGVTIPDSALINSDVNGYVTKTIEYDIRTDSDITSTQVIYEQGGSTHGYNLLIMNGFLYFSQWRDNNPPETVSVAIEPDTYYDVALVHDGNVAGDKLFGYVGGALAGTAPGLASVPSHGAAYLGSVQTNTVLPDGTIIHEADSDYPFLGVVSTHRHWSTARTQAELDANKDAELTGTETGLVLLYKLDEGSGSVAADSTVNALDGTIGSGAAWISYIINQLNAIEYFGSYGTPSSSDHVATGFRTPVTPGDTCLFSGYVEWEGVSISADYARTVIKNAAGDVVLDNPPLISSVTGSRDQQREWFGFVVPPDGAYLELVDGGGTDGRVNILALQLESAATVNDTPQVYTNENAASGFAQVQWNTHGPGVYADPRLTMIQDWLRAIIASTEDPDTSVTAEWQSSADEVTWSALTANLTDVPKQQYLRLRLSLATTDLTLSPVVETADVMFSRPEAILVREDGSEFEGGCIVVDMPAIETRPNVKERTFADNSDGVRIIGDARKYADGFGLWTPLEVGARQISEESKNGGRYQIEDPDLKERITVRFFKAKFPTDRRRLIETEFGPSWFYESNGINGRVLEVSEL